MVDFGYTLMTEERGGDQQDSFFDAASAEILPALRQAAAR